MNMLYYIKTLMDDIEECNEFLSKMQENKSSWNKYLPLNPLIVKKQKFINYTFIANVSVNFKKESIEMPLPKCIGADVFEMVKNRREQLIEELNSYIKK